MLRHHLAVAGSTNDVAKELAAAGAPGGTVVTAREQTAGRGRQGRGWSAPPGQALVLSVVVRPFGPLLPLAAAVAVAEACGERAQIKWPNDVLLEGRKVAGILTEARGGEAWAVVGIGLNAAVDLEALPEEVRARAATLGRRPDELDAVLTDVLGVLDRVLALDDAALLARWRARDALRGREVSWADGRGTALGVDAEGRLVVERVEGGREALSAGEVHLGS